MSMQDIQNEWPMYRLMVKAMYTGIDAPDVLEMAVANIGPFPADDPSAWDDWLHGLAFFNALNKAVEVTDAALKQEAQFVAATCATAALVVPLAPDDRQVTDLIDQLQVINGFIKRDQRFEAALRIGTALVERLASTLEVPLPPAPPPPSGSRVPLPPAPPPPSAPPLRFLQGRFPEHVRLKARSVLQVRIALQSGPDKSVPLKALVIPPGGIEVLLVLHAPGFTPLSDLSRRIHVPSESDSDWAPFELEAQQEGVHTLEVTAFHDGTYLGSLPLQVTIDSQRYTGLSMERGSAIDPRQREPGEVTLLIRYDADQAVYRYQFIDDTIGGLAEMQSNRLMRTPLKAVEDLVTQLNLVARGSTPFTAEQTREFLKNKGIELWDEFIPETLQHLFWARREKITRMMILSSGDPVPWEVLYPFAPGNHDASFLAEQFPIARWVCGDPPVHRLGLSQGYFVLPTNSPPTAMDEVTTLSAMLHESGIATHPPIDDLTQLLQLFRTPAFNLLHFSCHNSFKPESPMASSVLLGSQPFQPTFLNQHRSRFRSASPLVFMNACRTDGQAPNYTRLAGWATGFLTCGVGAFIGSLWEVRDRTASIFAQEFYQALLRKENLGNAMKKAREAIREEPGDPTWLAYTLYGDPAATFAGGSHE